MIRKLAFTAIFASTLLCFGSHAQAAGFYIQEQSVKGLGTAFAGSVTSIEDASTIYFNPAGMTKLDEAQANIGAHLLVPKSSFTDTGSVIPFGGAAGDDGGNPYSPTPVPNFYATTPVFDNSLWIGIGVNAPFGLANDYGDDWFGRFDSTKTNLKTTNIQPSIAFKATDWLSIGGGFDIQYVDATLESVANLGTGEGISTLDGDDWSYGYNVGLQIKPVENTEIGVHYRSAMEHELEGSISLQGAGAADFSEDGGADLNLPDIATMGIAHNINDQWRVMGQASWFGWNNFQAIAPERKSGTPVTPTVQNYKTTWAFSVGTEYEVNEDWKVRAGYQYDETPTRDLYRTSRTPDGDRNWFSAGATYKVHQNLELDFATTYIDISEEKINVSRNAGLANFRADVEGSVGIFALGVSYKF